MKKTAWFDRQFTFGLSIGMLPFYLERLTGTSMRMDAKVKGLSEEQLSFQLDDKWSIKQNIGHLADANGITTKRIQEILTGVSPMSRADLQTQHDYNQQPIKDVIGHFHEVRTKNLKRLHELTEEELGLSSLHPRLKVTMTPVDIALFDAEHDDHHLVRVNEIRFVLLNPK